MAPQTSDLSVPYRSNTYTQILNIILLKGYNFCPDREMVLLKPTEKRILFPLDMYFVHIIIKRLSKSFLQIFYCYYKQNKTFKYEKDFLKQIPFNGKTLYLCHWNLELIWFTINRSLTQKLYQQSQIYLPHNIIII